MGVTLEQFTHFMQQGEEQISIMIFKARENDLLYISETKKKAPLWSSVSQYCIDFRSVYHDPLFWPSIEVVRM